MRITLGKNRAILFTIFIFIVVNNYIIIRRDRVPSMWDAAGYYETSVEAYRILSSGLILKEPLRSLSLYTEIFDWRPPLFMLSSIPFYAVLGTRQMTARMSNTLFIAILIISVYLTGKKIRDDFTGILAVCLVMSSPIIIGFSRLYWADISLTAMVALSMYLLMRSDYFRNRRYSVMFGLSVGLGALTKLSYFVFILGPLIYYCIICFRKKDKKVLVANMLFSFISAFIVMSYWYIQNIKIILRHFYINVINLSGPSISIISKMMYYLKGLVFIELYPVYSCLLIFSVIYLVLSKKLDRVILIWISMPFLFFSVIIAIRAYRYLMPVVPALGLLMATAVSVYGRKMISILVLTTSLVQYILLSYTGFMNLNTGKFAWERFMYEGMLCPSTEDWAISWVTDILERETTDVEPGKRILVLSSMGIIPSALQCWQAASGKNIEIEFPVNLDSAFHSFEENEYYEKIFIEEYIRKFDYVLISENDDYEMLAKKRKILRTLKMMFRRNSAGFELVKEGLLPERTSLMLYKHVNTDITD